MGQLAFPFEFDKGRNSTDPMVTLSPNGKGVLYPVTLPPLPGDEDTGANAPIGEVWCGAEHTVACSEGQGNVYSSGWNDHGTLGAACSSSTINADTNCVFRWVPVLHSTTDSAEEDRKSPLQLRLPALYDGYLACGGAHCIATTGPVG